MRRRITIQHQRVRIRRSIERQEAAMHTPGKRTSTPRSQPLRQSLPLPARACPSCGSTLAERSRILDEQGRLFRRLHCTACNYQRIFKETIQ